MQLVTAINRVALNAFATHPLQSYEWGEFRQKLGTEVIRKGVIKDGAMSDGFQMTLHPIPYTPWRIGYVPKGKLPTKEDLNELIAIGKEKNCVFIQLEPNVLGIKNNESGIKVLTHNSKFIIQNSFHPLFTKYTFILDLTKSEEELLKAMHPKTRYNIKLAQKHGVEVVEDNSDKAFEKYLRLTWETTTRQKFYAHNEKYHRLMWNTLGISNLKSLPARPAGRPAGRQGQISNLNRLTAHLLLAKLTSNSQLVLVTWILFVFHDTLYYPYGASSSLHRETMASNLMMWEAIRFGKKLGLKKFDMWGALGPNPNPNDPWYGFHRFKQGYGPKLVEFAGSYDLVINPMLYEGYKVADRLRWILLRLKK